MIKATPELEAKIKASGVICAVSVIPKKAEEYGKLVQDAGADVLIIASTVTTVKHESTTYKSVDFKKVKSGDS